MKINTPKVDSLRLLIPFEDVEVNKAHSRFLRTIHTINSDGEILDSKKETTYRLHTNPCSSHYQLAYIIDNSVSTKVLKLGFSAKTLKTLYFDGITKENIDTIYDFIIAEDVIKISKETLLNARVVDTDICIDLILDTTTVTEAVSIAHQLSIPHKSTIANCFRKKNNVGIEWSDRNKVGKSYRKKQYLKYYAKSLELKHHSTVFYDTYIKGTDIDNKLSDTKSLRVETTIKNREHWKTYKVDVTTLKSLLEVDLTKHIEIFNRPINHYMQGINIINTRTDLTPNQKLQLGYMDLLNKLYDYSENEAITHMVSEYGGTTKQSRYQFKKALQKLVSENREIDIKISDEKQLDIITELEKLELIPKS